MVLPTVDEINFNMVMLLGCGMIASTIWLRDVKVRLMRGGVLLVVAVGY